MKLSPQSAIITSLLVLLLSARSFAATLPAACGDDSTQFKVKTEKVSGMAASAVASLVVIQDLDGDWSGIPVARIAIDGRWIGAVKGHSFFQGDITPGTHKVCVSRQASARAEKENISVTVVDAKQAEPVYLVFTLSRKEVGAARTHATDQMLGYATPDMTVKPHDTVDTASLAQVSPQLATKKMQGLSKSIATEK